MHDTDFDRLYIGDLWGEHLAQSRSISGGSDFSNRQANRERGAACDGLEPEWDIRPISSGSQSRCVVRARSEWGAAADAAEDICIGWEPLVFGIDETLERRWGAKIAARGIYRDPVRSSKSHLVKASGLRWISLMWLTEIPWAQRMWALPFFTVLAPSERYAQEQHKAHKTLTDWARQMVMQLRR